MNSLLLVAIALIATGARPRPLPRNSPTAAPCYAAMTIVVSDSAPYRIRRVITSGVRRFEDVGGGMPSACTPLEQDRLRSTQRAVETILDSTSRGGHLDRILIKGTSPEFVAEHLVVITAKARTANSGFKGVEVITIKGADGTATEELPLPALRPASERARCAEDNIALKQTGAPFHWAC